MGGVVVVVEVVWIAVDAAVVAPLADADEGCNSPANLLIQIVHLKNNNN